MCEYTIKCRIKSVNFKENKLYLTLAGTGQYFQEDGKTKYNLWFEEKDKNPFLACKIRENIEYMANFKGFFHFRYYAPPQFFLSLLTSGTICSITATNVYTPPKGDPPKVEITITSIKVEE